MIDRGFIGTAKYASIHVHYGKSPSRRDDMESLCYSLIYAYKGSLLWDRLPIENGQDRYKLIKECKKKNSFDAIAYNI